MSSPWWEHVRRQLGSNSAVVATTHVAALRGVLQDFARSGMVDRRDLPRLTDDRRSGRYFVSVGGGPVVVRVRRWKKYELSIDLTATEPTGEVLSFVMSVVRPGRKEPFASVHLDRPGMGPGACSHAVLHCHPFSFRHEVRVPMPPLSAAEALRWLLLMVATDDVQRAREPAPWKDAPPDVAPDEPGATS